MLVDKKFSLCCLKLYGSSISISFNFVLLTLSSLILSKFGEKSQFSNGKTLIIVGTGPTYLFTSISELPVVAMVVFQKRREKAFFTDQMTSVLSFSKRLPFFWGINSN